MFLVSNDSIIGFQIELESSKKDGMLIFFIIESKDSTKMELPIELTYD
jgi:hypothetical protein